jgi:hypothetical protein
MLRQALVTAMRPRGLLGKQLKDPSKYDAKFNEAGVLELFLKADASSSAGEAQVDAIDETFLDAKLDFTKPETFEVCPSPQFPLHSLINNPPDPQRIPNPHLPHPPRPRAHLPLPPPLSPQIPHRKDA